MTTESIAGYEFGSSLVDLVESDLYCVGQRQEIEDRVFNVLLVFVENPQRTLSREDIAEKAEIEAIHIDQLVHKVRKALNDTETRTLVETKRVRKRGYRFTADPKPIPKAELKAAIQRHQQTTAMTSPRHLKKPGDRRFGRALHAWSDIDFGVLTRFLVEYYQAHGVPLFSYPSATGRAAVVPLYVRPAWQNLTQDTLVLTQNPKREQVQLTAYERVFFDQYQEIREQLGLLPMWPGRVFRLVSLQPLDPALHLHFEHGSFFDAVACQYALEHELRLALIGGKPQARRLRRRDSLASTTTLIEGFCSVRVARVGVSNLLLLRSTRDTYRPVVRKRGGQSMGHAGDFDPISSGVFDISTDSGDIDFSLEHKVLKEVYEELFGGVEVERELMALEPDFFYYRPGIGDLREMLKDGRATFQITGFCIDLVRVIPEITTVLVVRDDSYYRRHRADFKVNLEYEGLSSFFEIPGKLGDIDRYLTKHFPSVPGHAHSGVGFDPLKWTLPGGFCFYQGLKRAIADGLL